MRTTIIRRDDVELEIVFTDQDGNAIDINGATVFFTLKRRVSDTDEDALVVKEVTEHSSPSEGETTISLSNSETDIPSGVYFYDLQIRNTEDKITSSDSGQIRISQDITIRVEPLEEAS